MKCKICNKTIVGRTDKKYCSVKCKNYYHQNLRNVTELAVKDIDTILHRNRSILLEVLGKRIMQITVKRMVLDRKKFNFNYHTHLYVNSRGKTYYHIYDMAWMSFSEDEIMIVRRRKVNN